MSNLKLGVDVVGARNLLPKDGQGSSNAFVELSFDGLKQRTTIKEKDLNPIWNESFYFNICDPSDLQYLTLDAYVYSSVKATSSKSRTRSFLGKISLPSSSFVQDSSDAAVVLHYRLEKHRTFSRVRGELCLKVYVTGDPSIISSTPIAAVDSLANANMDTTLAVWTQGDSNPPIIRSTSPDDADIGTGHTSPHHEDNVSTSNKSSSPIADVRSLAIANKDTILALAWTQGDSNPPAAINDNSTSPNAEAGIGTTHSFIHRPNPSHDQGDKKPSTSRSVPVGQMYFLYVRVVKARDLPAMDVAGNLSPFVEATIGNYKGFTKKHFRKETNPVWDQVFSFSRDLLQASVLDVVVKDKDEDCVVGLVTFDLNEIPVAPPESDTASSLAPEWYSLVDKEQNEMQAKLMLSIWYGTQTDEAFSDAGNSNAASVVDSTPLASTVLGSNVYLAPRLWYVRVTVIGVEDLQFTKENRFPDAYVKVLIGNQVLETTIQARKRNLVWNEDLLFVAAEPFLYPLVVVFVDHARPDKDEIIGSFEISLHFVEKRTDNRRVSSRWCSLYENHQLRKRNPSGRIHLRMCMEGGYHVSYDSPLYNSDVRPTAKQLWRRPIGVVELGILDAEGLHPIKTRDGRGTADTYCVAKYGRKWVRTRIHFDNLSPKYNETHSWEVFDPATVLTVGVFLCSQLGLHNNSTGDRDLEIGKIRIRISTLEAGRRYTQSYPLLVVQPNGVIKLGELNLTIRFSCTSLLKMLFMYSQPVMPKMHYLRPMTVTQLGMLYPEAINIVAERFSRAEPPLKKEVVEYMSDGDSHLWSMRRSQANFFRLTLVFSGLLSVAGWFIDICMWKNPIMTVLAHILFLMLVCSPRLILPTTFLYMFLTGLWNFWFRLRDPPLIDTKLTQAQLVDLDELEEELDTVPTSQSRKVVIKRYDRLRRNASKVQKVVGDVASVGERIQILLSWRDSCATALFVTFCLLAALVLYVTPFQVVAGLAGFFMMMHPRFRSRFPSAVVPLINFFGRLPDRSDIML